MDIRKYEAFLYAADLGSFSAAAEKLSYTPAGISHMVESIEQSLDITLFNRHSSGVSLTENGRELLPHIRAIVRDEQLLKNKASDINGLLTGSVTVGSYYSIATHWLPPLIRDFSRLYPGISIQIREGGHQIQEQWLRESAIDFAMCSREAGTPYHWIPLEEDPMVLVVPSGHPFAARSSVSLEECSQEAFIMPALGDDYDVSRLLARHKVRLYVRYSTVENYCAIAMVECGLGISIMNRLITKGLNRNIVCVPLEPAASVPLGIMVPDHVQTPAVRSLISFIRENFR